MDIPAFQSDFLIHVCMYRGVPDHIMHAAAAKCAPFTLLVHIYSYSELDRTGFYVILIQ